MPNQGLSVQTPLTRTSASGGVGGSGGGPLPWAVKVIAAPADVVVSNPWLLPLDLASSALISVTDAGATLGTSGEIWLACTLNGAGTDVASADIGYGSSMGAALTYSSGVQTEFRFLLGRVEASDPAKPGIEFTLSGTTYHFTQFCGSTLRVVAGVMSGKYALYVRPA